MHSTAEVTALTIAPAAVLEAVALNAEAAVTSFARDAVQRAQMTAPDPAAVVVVVALAFCGANRDERRNQNGDILHRMQMQERKNPISGIFRF